MRLIVALLISAALATTAHAAEFRLEEVPLVTAVPIDQLKPGVIAFSDHRKDELVDSTTGLIKFADWERERPQQKQLMSLYPSYEEPMVKKTSGGVTTTRKERLHMYVVEARFLVNKSNIDLGRYATLPFIEKLDPAITSKTITAADAMPLKEAQFAYNRIPDRPWCEDKPNNVCLTSRYKFEGKLPIGITLLNQLRESSKKIATYIDFESELRVLAPDQIDEAKLKQLTAVDTPITGVLEQNIFWVNQIMQFGKFVAIAQKHPTDAGETVVTVFAALAVDSDLFEKKKEYEHVPVLRNLVPAQVLAGNSSFNTGHSISSGLPNYARNRIKSIADVLENDKEKAAGK
jgi:hypothetical protein